jgi:chromosome segregation ATPase
VRGLEEAIARLQTDVTVARAELESAHGSRVERAALAAAEHSVQQQQAQIQSLQSERDRLAGQSAELKKELAELVTELEEMTKAGVETEKEREGLELVIDGLRDKCESLETKLAEHRITSLGGVVSARNSSKAGIDSPGREMTSTMVLKTEFKKLMREAKAESLKAFKVS